MSKIIKGKIFVVGDNIDTDQIIPARYLNLVPTIHEEYKKLGAKALSGLPEKEYPTRFVKEGQYETEFPIIIAGKNFGCGSSREHAPVCLGASGAKAVVAESFARIFFRNCVSTGNIYPIEFLESISKEFSTGDEAEIDLETMRLKKSPKNKQIQLKELGDVKEVVEAGGIFNYARSTGMIKN